ncbi:MAG: DUF202 domain-containing protein [Actinomycetes bacterium]
MSGPPAGQQERTLLAWRRTSLALVGTSLVALHLAITQGSVNAIVAAFVCVGFGLATALESQLAYSSSADVPRSPAVILLLNLLCIASLAVVGISFAVSQP